MSEYMKRPKNNILIKAFLLGITVVGAVGQFWISVFLEALKTKSNDF